MAEAAEILLGIFLELKDMADTAQNNKRFAKQVAARMAQFEPSIEALRGRALNPQQQALVQNFLELMEEFKNWFSSFTRKKPIKQFFNARTNNAKLTEFTERITQLTGDLGFANSVETGESLSGIMAQQQQQDAKINELLALVRQSEMRGDAGQQDLALTELAELTQTSKDEVKGEISNLSAEMRVYQEQLLNAHQRTYDELARISEQLNRKQVSRFASKITNEAARDFWEEYLPDDRQVSWSQFKECFVHCFCDGQPMSRDFEAVFRSKLDKDGDGYITNLEFGRFAQTWSVDRLQEAFASELAAAAQADLDTQRTMLVQAPKRRGSVSAPPPQTMPPPAPDADAGATAGDDIAETKFDDTLRGGDLSGATSLSGNALPQDGPEPAPGSGSTTTLDVNVFRAVFQVVQHKQLTIEFPTRQDLSPVHVNKHSIRGGRAAANTTGGASGGMYMTQPWAGEQGVSRNHFDITYNDSTTGDYTITDGGSLGGTWVRLMRGGNAALRQGCIFKIGQHLIKVDQCAFTGLMPVRGMPPTSEAGNFAAPWADTVGNTVQASAAASITLRCVGVPGTPLLNQQWRLDGVPDNTEYVIGRHPQAWLRVAHNGQDIDSQVSGVHARIQFRDGLWFLIDGSAQRGSSNGTWFSLNQDREVSPRPMTLADGAEVMVGSVVMRMAITPEEGVGGGGVADDIAMTVIA